LEERLKEYPELKAKIEAMLAMMEDAGGDVAKAAEAERRIIEELRQMGNEVLQSWARRQQEKKETEYNAKPGVNRKEKKPLLVHATGKNRNRRTDLHPRSPGAADSTLLRVCGSGMAWVFGSLQRAMTDFGADEAFAGAAAKRQEPYGIEVPVSAVGRFTEEHGAAMLAQEKAKSDWPDRAGVPVVISEMEGSMLPVVETAEAGVREVPIDRRKTRQVGGKEARLALAHPPGSVTPIFGATLGSVEEGGERLAVCAWEAGAGSQTKIHGVGDGAVWIMEQMEAQFGTQAKYLVDFYHRCDYLAAAGEVIAGNDPPAWMKEKVDWLKDNRWKEVLEALRPSLEPANIPDPEAPVRACFRYLSNHSDFLDYQGALAAGLPIGSGEIESGHRCVFQHRLKIAGSWWKTENLRKMIALRVLRANRGWEDYWSNVHQEAA
jgi:hypothetical protein